MLRKIPKTFKIGLVDSVLESDYQRYSNEGKILFFINPIPKKDANNKKIKSITSYHYSKYRDVIKFKDISNSGFKVRLNLGSASWRNYASYPILEVFHEKFKDLPYQPCISISYNHFLDLLSSVNGNLSNLAELPGTFKIMVGNVGLYPNYYLVNEDNHNYLDELSIRYGNILETKQRTGKWVPGNMYVLTDRTLVLYLGKGKDLKSSRRFYDYSTRLCDLFEENNSVNLDINNTEVSPENAIVIPLITNYYSDNYSYLVNPPLDIVITIKSLVENYFNNDKRVNISYYKLKNGKFPLAIDMGKLVNLNSDFFREDILSDLINEIINNIISKNIKYNNKTRNIFLSRWLNSSEVIPKSDIKYEFLKGYLVEKQHLLDYCFKNTSNSSNLSGKQILDTIINYKSKDINSYKDKALVNLSTEFLSILEGNTKFGEVKKEYFENLLKESMKND